MIAVTDRGRIGIVTAFTARKPPYQALTSRSSMTPASTGVVGVAPGVAPSSGDAPVATSDPCSGDGATIVTRSGLSTVIRST
jgi:hypothetical protein